MTNTQTQPVNEETYTTLQEIMGDEFAELVGFFREDAEQALATLPHSIETANSLDVSGICHKLKSSSRLIGAMEMAEFARLLEEYKRHQDQQMAQNHLNALTHEYSRVIAWLENHPIH